MRYVPAHVQTSAMRAHPWTSASPSSQTLANIPPPLNPDKLHLENRPTKAGRHHSCFDPFLMLPSPRDPIDVSAFSKSHKSWGPHARDAIWRSVRTHTSFVLCPASLAAGGTREGMGTQAKQVRRVALARRRQTTKGKALPTARESWTYDVKDFRNPLYPSVHSFSQSYVRPLALPTFLSISLRDVARRLSWDLASAWGPSFCLHKPALIKPDPFVTGLTIRASCRFLCQLFQHLTPF
jgi:hypothetical protein